MSAGIEVRWPTPRPGRAIGAVAVQHPFIALADLVGFDRTAAGIHDLEALLRDEAEIEGFRSCDAAEVIYAYAVRLCIRPIRFRNHPWIPGPQAVPIGIKPRYSSGSVGRVIGVECRFIPKAYGGRIHGLNDRVFNDFHPG